MTLFVIRKFDGICVVKGLHTLESDNTSEWLFSFVLKEGSNSYRSTFSKSSDEHLGGVIIKESDFLIDERKQELGRKVEVSLIHSGMKSRLGDSILVEGNVLFGNWELFDVEPWSDFFLQGGNFLLRSSGHDDFHVCWSNSIRSLFRKEFKLGLSSVIESMEPNQGRLVIFFWFQLQCLRFSRLISCHYEVVLFANLNGLQHSDAGAQNQQNLLFHQSYIKIIIISKNNKII